MIQMGGFSSLGPHGPLSSVDSAALITSFGFSHPLLLDNSHPPLGLCFGYALREAFLTLLAAPTPYFLLANAPCQGLCNYLINISLVH